MTARVEVYGTTGSGATVERVVIRDGIEVHLLTYGGLIERLLAPGPDGMANVVLGLADLATYEARNPSFGITAGRYANRIGGARFTLDGVEHRLTANEHGNTLHGGVGFGRRVWRVEAAEARTATLAYTSVAGEDGFPGTLEARVTFSVEGERLRLEYAATTDAPTVVNLTNHSYFNLAGEGSGSALDHVLQIEAGRILELDAHSVPTGRMLDVAGTPFDFRAANAVASRLREAHPQIVQGLGYDCCYVLDGAGLRRVATLRGGGRVLTLSTDQPGLQLYSGNKLTGALTGPSGRVYRSGDGIALETQHYPDSPSHPQFPSTVLRPGGSFRTATEFDFSIR